MAPARDEGASASQETWEWWRARRARYNLALAAAGANLAVLLGGDH